MVDARDPIPANATGLVDACEKIFRAMTPNSAELLSSLPLIRHVEFEDPNREAIEARNQEARRKSMDYDQAPLKANKWLRARIGDGSIAAHIRDPDLGVVFRLPTDGWEDSGLFQEGITSNYVSPDDPINPGPPEATLKGLRRPVFFFLEDFEKLVAKYDLGASGDANVELPSYHPSHQTKKSRKGQGSFEKLDRPFLERIDELLKQGKVASVEAAARLVANEAPGGGTPESKAERLANRYRRSDRK